MSKKNISPRAILSGGGSATLYFDINGGGTCGPVNGWYSFAETGGFAMCEPWTNPKTLAQRASNRVVAVPSNVLNGRTAELCGKEIVAHWNGRTVANLILWDGCARCNSDNGLDFSSSVFGELVGESNCGMGTVNGMTWEVTNKQIWDTNGNVVSGGGDDSGSDDDWEEPASSSSSEWVEPSSSSSSTWTPEATPSSSSSQWSSSSEWVATSSSSSSSKKEAENKWTEPSSSAAPQPSKKEEDAVFKPSEQKVQLVQSHSPNMEGQQAQATSSSSASSSASASVGQEPLQNAAPTASSSSSSSSSDDEGSAPEPEATQVSDEESAAVAAQDQHAPEDVCNDSPGAWKCDGWTLKQCLQTTGDWIWAARVKCAVEPLNCDSANPVCPTAASCPSRRAVKLNERRDTFR